MARRLWREGASVPSTPSGLFEAFFEMAGQTLSPYVRETVGVLYKQPNVATVPGQYVHYDFPGSMDYVHALRRQCPDQILFGSVYPNCGPLPDLILRTFS